MIERLSIHNSNKRQHSDLFLRSVCQWLLSFSRVHRCLLGCDPNSDEGQFIIDQLPHIPLYEGGVARADWFIDAFFDQSHEHLYEQIHARVLSVVLPTRDMEGKIKCDQILLDQAYMPQTFNHPHFEHHAIPFSPETGLGYFVDLEPFEASEKKAVHKYDQGAVVLFGSAPFVSALKMSAQAAMLAGLVLLWVFQKNPCLMTTAVSFGLICASHNRAFISTEHRFLFGDLGYCLIHH